MKSSNIVKQLLKIVNEIISLAEIDYYFRKQDIDYQTYTIGENTINFLNENRYKYLNAISKAFSLDSEIERSYTIEKYKDSFIDFFSELIIKKTEATEQCVEVFYNQLKSQVTHTFSVFREIYGITFKTSTDPVSLGNYTIYHFQSHKHIIEAKSSVKPEDNRFDFSSKYLIEWKADAKHYTKAIEIADSYFEKFELILHYIIGRPTSKYEVKIFNYQGRNNRDAIVFSDGGLATSSTSHGASDELPVDHPSLTNEDLGYKSIWQMADTNSLNQFHKRILLAIEWIGRSIMEPLPQSAFLKAAIALEKIFTYNEKTIINASILSQISEGTAFILGKSVEERLEIEKEVKKLYELRSAIVHSGNKDISRSDHIRILKVSKSVLTKLLTSEKLMSIDSIENLHKLLKRIKYSGDTF